MKRTSRLLLLFAASFFLLTTGAMALPSGVPSNAQLQDVFDNIAVDGANDVNVFTDMLTDSTDSYWNITATGTSAASFIIELGSFVTTNTFGVFNGLAEIELFDGTATTGHKAELSIGSDGSISVTYRNASNVVTGFDNYAAGTFSSTTFGFYLDSTAETSAVADGGKWYSDTSKNSDGEDHMLAYRGVNEMVDIDLGGLIPAGLWTPDEYILAFEDLDDDFIGPAGGSADFNYVDMVVMVESVTPIPEPATLVLLGLGLLGIAGFGRNRIRK